jgi:hypothetical protein
VSRLLRVAAIALSFASAGCAIHPLPEDVTGVTTYHIVRRIRCEAKEAVIETAIGWLTSKQNEEEGKVDPVSRAIGWEFASGARPIETLSPKLFPARSKVRTLMELFWETGIAYNFELDMEENNDFSTEFNFLKPIKNDGRFTLGLGARADRRRENSRIFTITDTFGKLVRELPPAYCLDHIVGENHIYPMTGKIGMAKVIQEFIRLTLFANLGGPKEKPAGPPTMVDQLEFETFISGSATPRVEFSPLGNAFQLANASLTARVSRRDIHKVTVGLAVPVSSVPRVAAARSMYFVAPLLTATGGPTEQAAAEAVNQVLTLKLFKRTIIAPR